MLPLLAAIVMANQDLKPVPPIPSPRQLAWHKLERYCFCHFGPNTFTGQEWGTGKEPAELFNPKHLDCRQWCRAFKAAGFKGVMITAKHHDGFCLWPSKYSTHTVAQSPWKTGKGDVLKELSQACKAEGMKFGVYLSPWDRNHPSYGTPEYNETFKSMLREVLTNYGPVFEVWFDGANGEGPNGKRQVYDWPGFVKVVRECQPNAVIFSDAGPDIRWVGNEDGYAGETSWNMIDPAKFPIGSSDQHALNVGDPNGPNWIPPECDVSIRPGWFWRASEDSKVKSVEKLLDIWYGSVGRGANLLLNVPPNADGLISDVDAKRLLEFDAALKGELATQVKPLSVSEISYGCSASTSQDPFPDELKPRGKGFELKRMLDGNIQTYWAAPAHATTCRLTFIFDGGSEIDRMVLREPIERGQRISSFDVQSFGSGWARGTTVGRQRIVRLPPARAQMITLNLSSERGEPALSDVAFFSSRHH